jgi:hypothetical protein
MGPFYSTINRFMRAEPSDLNTSQWPATTHTVPLEMKFQYEFYREGKHPNHSSGHYAKLLFFFDRIGIWTQGFMSAKQAFYHVSHTYSPFCSCYFEDEVLWTIYPGWPWTLILPVSARITAISHWHPGIKLFFKELLLSEWQSCAPWPAPRPLSSHLL